MQHTVETLSGGTMVLTSPAHRFGTDALLLLEFCEMRKTWAACDLGSGSGILLLGLLDKGLQGAAVGIEQDEEGASLLAETARQNGYTNITALHMDMRDYRPARQFDLVICNPPYFSGGIRPPTTQRAVARHQVSIMLEEVCFTAGRILKDKGRFCLCYPAAGLPGLFAVLQAGNLAPKQLQLVRKTAADEPWLCLVNARKAAGEGGLHILPDHLLPPGQPIRFGQ
jgi:tRNA1(Val) A37 N6-methylase TrmN6